jgi:hypothetical protein
MNELLFFLITSLLIITALFLGITLAFNHMSYHIAKISVSLSKAIKKIFQS